MAASHKTFLCLFLFFGIVGLGLHLVGFVVPGWMVMKRSVVDIRLSGLTETEITEKLRIMRGEQKIDDGGLPFDKEDDHMRMPHPEGEDHDGRRPSGNHGPHHGGHGGMMPPENHMSMPEQPPREADMMEKRPMKEDWGMMEFSEEDITIHEFLLTVMAEVSFEEVTFHYGLWFTKICAHGEKPKDDKWEDEDDTAMPEKDHMRFDDDSSSSSSSDEHHGKKHHKKCHCKKVSTKCALKNAWIVESAATMKGHRLSPSNMGHGSLKEHRIETTIGLALMVIGLILGIVTHRKADGCRCVKIATILTMLVAVVLVSVPVMRFAHYNHYRRNLHDGVDVRCPFSAIMSGAGCVMVLVSSLITLCGLIAQKRRETAGQWYRFNNELATEKKPEKGPALVFYNDPYPVKAGLTDVCDFSDIKPVETIAEPEKKILE